MRKILTALALTFAFLIPALALAGEAKEAKKAPVTRVADVKQVCMVNNHFMGKDQIPVKVGEKTYYGCCEMCKQKLASDASSRSAVDPVSGAKVDKATAVIGAQADGSVLYFENEANLKKYAGQG
jgi:YHS domain-containing protein